MNRRNPFCDFFVCVVKGFSFRVGGRVAWKERLRAAGVLTHSIQDRPQPPFRVIPTPANRGGEYYGCTNLGLSIKWF